MNLLDKLTDLLKKEEKFVVNGKLLKNKIVESALKLDSQLIKLLLSDEIFKKYFFTKIEDVMVFDKEKFLKFISNKKFLPDSYTTFKNKIGLAVGEDKYFYENKDVVVNFPYKDCVLVGGQDKEDVKRDEVFYNYTLAPDEVDALLEPKVFTNIKKYTENGIEEVEEIKDTDNLIIKGNNLFALHSLKKRFAGKVKLIYIDPPYNTGSDSFKYNDSFNHSTWLTFMKNRLEVAKELLAEDGIIYVQCDINEQAYLKVLMDEIFPFFQFMITVQVKSPSGDSSKSKSMLEDVCEYILCYSKLQYINHNNPQQIKEIIDSNSKTVNQYNKIIKSLGKITEEFIEFEIGHGKNKEKIKAYKVEDFEMETIPKRQRTEEFYKSNIDKICRTAAFSGAFKKVFSRNKDNVYVFKYTTTRGKNQGIEQTIYAINGEQLIYLKDYSKELEINGANHLVKMEKYPNIITDISWQGIANEGNVVLRKGKKPEELLKRLIEWTTEEGDIVLDYHLGSGTTAAVAHKLNRQYIGIEQLDYGENDSVVRLQNVINGDTTGISKSVNWQGGGSFVYMELYELNKKFDRAITECQSNKEALQIFEDMLKNAILKYSFDLSKADEVRKFIEEKELNEIKKLLFSLLEPNYMYLNYSEIEDETYQVSDKDKKINKSFYKDF